MNRTPPTLAYLTIYNPSLHSLGSLNDNDEDAEEQAHILFYTSKERAVSRDKMLRQIGLAKALVSFSEMFNGESPLDSVHSQTRRMIMVSPEPNFWIHACIELGKIPRIVNDKGKGKTKGKGKEKEKAKEASEAQAYHYDDGSMHDNALREDIMKGYERFKLTHASFTEILRALGQEALGLQLERFWTPWAWTWALEDGHHFAEQLGVALHPYFKTLLPVLDDLQDDLLEHDLTPVLLTQTSIIPSTAYLHNDYPTSLPLYLSSLIPPPRDPSIQSQDDPLASSQLTIKGIANIKGSDLDSGQGLDKLGSFLNVDVRKWNWSGMLTFGRSSAKTSPQGSSAATSATPSSATSSPRASTDQSASQDTSPGETENVEGKEKEKDAGSIESSTGDLRADQQSVAESVVDQSALDDAISSEVSPTPSVRGVLTTSGSSSTLKPLGSLRAEKDNDVTEDDARGVEEGSIQDPDLVTPKALPAFMKRRVYLQDNGDPLVTSEGKVCFLLKGQWMLALVGRHDQLEGVENQGHLDKISGKSENFFQTVEDIIQEELMKSIVDSLPSASKILQPVDTHIGSTGKYTFGHKNFRSKSGMLHEAKALQERDPEVLEVFSRGQNPQYWYMARRMRNIQQQATTPTIATGGSVGLGEPSEMYMEVFRKETSLADVDNVLAGAVKSWKGVVEDVEGL